MALISSGPAPTEPLWFVSPGGYQRLFAFTGSLGHHRAWRAKYKGVRVSLSEWSDQAIDPRTKKQADAVLTRLKAAVDAGTFSPEGEQQSLGAGQRLSDFIFEWQTHYAEEYGLTSNSLSSMLGVIRDGVGSFTLEQLAGRPELIERWLNRMQKERSWTENSWNRYHELLHSVFNRAIKWKRLKINPVMSIDKRVGTKRKFEVRMEEGIEDRLLAACEKLNRPQHAPHSKLLTWPKVEEIRSRVAAGESQKAVAGAFGISTGLCCQIVKGDIWNPAKYRTGTKGDEMKRRIYAAFDLGLRANTRHEFVSRHAENTGDPILTQHLARHKDLRTTQGYFHARQSRLLKAAVRLERKAE
jgi:integrase